MRLVPPRLLVPLLLCASAGSTFAACVSDDAVLIANNPGADAGTPGSDGASVLPDGAPPPDAAVTPDSSLVCATNTGDCDNNPANGCETPLQTSAAHCRACGRSCGGGTCIAGDCLPANVASVSGVRAIALVQNAVVFYSDFLLQSCAKTGCASATQIANTGRVPGSFALRRSPHYLATTPSDVYFMSCPGGATNCEIYYCPLAGCPSSQPISFSAATSGGDGNLVLAPLPAPVQLFWWNASSAFVRAPIGPGGGLADAGLIQGVRGPNVDYVFAMVPGAPAFAYTDDQIPGNGGGVYVCPPNGCPSPTLPTKLVSARSQHLAVHAGVAYFTYEGKIGSCSLTGCTGIATEIAVDADVTDIAVDASGVYWLSRGVLTGPTGTGRVLTCPLAGCGAAPPRVLAANENAPSAIDLDADFVYWANFGTTGSNGAIRRVRK